ncbi:hypothetical protein ACOXXX_08580 [Thalassococcus sp. BH17M4-6]|uniref:hypothetical protein n=1 Tax=Thalassococcus sp. BH17M4-6 TaxID=3413148 RepID=UPI003BBC9C18
MSFVNELADKLAEDTFKAMKELGDDRFYMEVAKELAASSTTLEEAFLTSVRVRMAERRARVFIERRLAGQAKDQDG